MYKVFVNRVPIILSTEKNVGKNYRAISIEEANIIKLIDQIRTGKIKYLHLYHEDYQQLFDGLKKQLNPVTAAGGLVYNSNSEILFIRRKGLWDLPKGKAEKNESIEETATREVEEETGVENLEIVRSLPATYHIFLRNGLYFFKETFWFEMKTDFQGKLKPQTEESIDQATWKNYEESRKALKNTFSNIKLLFPSEYLL